jgi:transcriptional regulator with XRE-family HTH domain
MKLGDWLHANRVTHEAFGEMIGRSHSSVTRYVNGDRMPSRETLSLIATATAGAVTANDFVGSASDSEAPAAA